MGWWVEVRAFSPSSRKIEKKERRSSYLGVAEGSDVGMGRCSRSRLFAFAAQTLLSLVQN